MAAVASMGAVMNGASGVEVATIAAVLGWNGESGTKKKMARTAEESIRAAPASLKPLWRGARLASCSVDIVIRRILGHRMSQRHPMSEHGPPFLLLTLCTAGGRLGASRPGAQAPR